MFDAWGEIIKVQDGAGNILTKLTFIERGYTGHEHLQSFKLINMNGRLYDPRIHRFLQPDNNLQEPYNTQNYNRYGYVLNNPLKYTDPTGDFTWSDFVAGVAIVAGVVLTIASVGTLASVGAFLIGAGVTHFGLAASNYYTTGSETKGDWDASSTKAGINFSSTEKTDFGYGGKKDVANNNNPVEGHPQVSCGYAGIAAASFLNNPITTDYNNIYDYYNNGQVFSNQGELEGYINKYIGNQDKIEKTMKTCFILATNNNVPPGYSLFDNDIIKPDGGRAGGVTVPMLKNSSNIFIAPSLKGDYFGIVRATSQGIVHETLHAFHLSKGLANFNNYSEGATSMYT